jgi:hypothetical protein
VKDLLIPVLVVVLAGTTWLAVAQEQEPVPTYPDSMSWLTGSWRQEGDGAVWEEHWLPPEGGTLVGATRLVVNGETKLYELSVIERQEDEIYLRLRHFGAGLTIWKSEAGGARSWRLTRLEDREVTFEDPEAADLQRIVYRSPMPEVLEVDLVAGEEMVQHFRFARIHR